MLITRKNFIKKIRDFIRDNKISKTKFGRESCGNPHVLNALEEGKTITLDTVEKIERFMDKIERNKVEADALTKDIRTVQ